MPGAPLGLALVLSRLKARAHLEFANAPGEGNATGGISRQKACAWNTGVYLVRISMALLGPMLIFRFGLGLPGRLPLGVPGGHNSTCAGAPLTARRVAGASRDP